MLHGRVALDAEAGNQLDAGRLAALRDLLVEAQLLHQSLVVREQESLLAETGRNCSHPGDHALAKNRIGWH